jgi:lipopolysaccharide transport system ATP-binding protein
MKTSPDTAAQLLSVRQLSKKFCKDLKLVIGYEALGLLGSLFGRGPRTDSLRRGEAWALRDIDLTLDKGRILGVVGRNGSGKTTLLRLLAGIFPPDAGEIEINGRIASLISPEMGFEHHLTVKENIFLIGALIGMRKADIAMRLPQIVRTWGVAESIDVPVGALSAGSFVRLGFALAIVFEPEVLFVDEMLTYADGAFREECIATFRRIAQQGCVVIASHDGGYLSEICTDIAVLERGRLVHLTSDVKAGMAYYQALLKGSSE